MTTTRNYSLRAVEPEDAAWMVEIENDPLARRYGTWTAPLSENSLQEYAFSYAANPVEMKSLRLVGFDRDHRNTPLAIVDLTDIDIFNARAYVGIYVLPEARGKGLASRLIPLLAGYCRDTLGLNQLVANVEVDNIPSRRLFEKCGFRQVALLPSWFRRGQGFIDVCRFILTL